MYWDTTIITDRQVQHNRPDMVVVDKAERSCIIIDYADNIRKAYQEKKEKYQYLADEIKDVWRIKKSVNNANHNFCQWHCSQASLSSPKTIRHRTPNHQLDAKSCNTGNNSDYK
nr:unnamed protein product [Callosobruchus analis]